MVGIAAALLLATLLFPSPARADVTLPGIFGEGMVLQRGRPVVVWGRADPREVVSVRYGWRGRTTTADKAGHWRVTLPVLEVEKPRTLIVKGKNVIRLRDVAVGEVWICSGQSNMAWPVSHAKDAQAEIAAANHPDLRLFRVPNQTAEASGSTISGRWERCSPTTVHRFSAVAYYFGREILRETKVPVGLILTAWGGTPAEAWTPRAALEAQASLEPLLTNWAARIEKAPDEGKARTLRRSPHRPANLWRGMVEPLVPFTCRGVIWYQGESNAGRAWQYRTLFPTLIGAWREAWGEAELPFYFVQLANYKAVKTTPGPSQWAELRDAQLFALRSLPSTGMAVAIDIGEAKDIHPKNKQEVGRRLAQWALWRDYRKDVVPSGPLYASMDVERYKVRLRFEHAEGLGASDGRELLGFTVAGEDQRFVRALAKIEGDTVVVFSPEVAEPKAVRYAWADNPVANLVNGASLPASPFRTDPPSSAGH